MNHKARDRRDVYGGIMLIASLVAVVGAFLIYRIQPWGLYAAGALMLAWAILGFVVSYLGREESDGPALPAAPPMHPMLRAIAALLFLAGAGALVYAWLLDRQGASGDAVRDWQTGGVFLFFLSNIGTGALEWLRRQLTQPRTA